MSSPPPEALPQVPSAPMRNQSSASSISNLFKDLIGRSRNSTSDIPSASTNVAPVQGIFARRPSVSALPRHINTSSPDNADYPNIRHSLRIRPSHYDADIQIPPVLGGPPELEELLERLSPKASLSSRIDAAHRLCPILEQYPVKGVWAVWVLAQESLLRSKDSEAIQAACRLLSRLVQLPNLSSAERSNFFSFISSADQEQIVEMRLQLLGCLTNGGRNIDALENKIAPLLTRMLDRCYQAARKARNAQKDSKLDAELVEDANLQQVFRFIIDVLKFNSQLLADKHIEELLGKVLYVSRRTARKPDLKGGITVIETLITYAELPQALLKPCLELLCSVCNRMLFLDDLRDQAERVIMNAFNSHVAPAAVYAFIEILYGELGSSKQRTNVVRGAVKVLEDLLFHPRAAHLQELQLSLFLPALNNLISVEYENRRATETTSDADRHTLKKIKADNFHLESDICNIMWKLLISGDADNKYTRQLLSEYDWSTFLEIVIKCANDVSDNEVRDFTHLASETFSNPTSDGEEEEGEEEENTHPSIPLRGVLLKLFEIRNELDIIQRQEAMAMLVRVGPKLPDDIAKGVIQYYEEERLLQPPSEDWRAAWEQLLSPFFKDKRRSSDLRIFTMSTIIRTYDYISFMLPSDVQISCAKFILGHMNEEADPQVLAVLADAAVNMATEAPDDMFEYIMDLFRVYLWEFVGTLPDHNSESWSSMESQVSPSNVITKALVRIFIRTFVRLAWKASKAYELILYVVGTSTCGMDARISAIKFLARLRSDANYALRVNSSPEGESMAAVLGRTADTALPIDEEDTASIEAVSPTHNEEKNVVRRSLVGAYPQSRAPSRVSSGAVKVKPVKPLWMYPEFEGLPEEPPQMPSLVLFTSLEGDENDDKVDNEEHQEDDDYFKVPNREVFATGLWLEKALFLFQHCTDWEILSYLLVHIGPQLCNHTLWKNCIPQIRLLRSILCDQIRNGTVPEPPPHASLKKADVAVSYFHILTMLISYHHHFEKSEQDDMVKSFYLGIGSWDRTSKWCIHALTVCCHEIPDSTTKHLQNFVQKMSQIITQPLIAIHILEFLTHLVRLPNLYVNFRDDEFKMVFGVCFRYLQYVRDQQERAANPPARLSGAGPRHSGPSRDLRDSKIGDQHVKPSNKPDDLPQYVHALAYHVISFWFMAIKLEDREKFVPWIIKKLVHTDRYGRETIEEQALITIDMLHSRAYTDRDETGYQEHFAKESDGEISKRSWVIGGEMILTLETAARTGITQMIKRRPSYTSYGIYCPHLIPPPRHQVPLLTGLAADAFYTSSYIGVLPEDIFQGLFTPITLFSPNAVDNSPWVKLPEDDATRRSISMLDRASTVDSHRVGVIFIGEGQTGEQEILANVMGSADYTVFVEALGEGKLVRLKGAKMNLQGLDREFDSDGTHAICWRDRAVEMIFHVITMMPTDLETDPLCINKKKHIGNDFVNIVFNNSGLPFRFDMFPSQFNYVYIVITPEARTTFVDTRDNVHLDQFYKVQVLTQPGFPEVSPASETKIISGKGLPAYVRMLALNASVFCQVWSSRDAGEYVSSWRSRLREIKRLWDRHSLNGPTPPSSASGPGTGMSNSMFHRQSVVTYNSDGNRSSIMSGTSADMERQNSSGSRG
ncbi:Rap/ran-GAP [Macrophomina phaseolina MS6]|uniref:Rap/ran-GAP n=1 Tax=Macrophomina phaseolina (strain MS6) TaxID=1126212 RepID=K2S397_MACPH|nr:Rap/ran-GAP [Macrophomina phaseolina MS6]